MMHNTKINTIERSSDCYVVVYKQPGSVTQSAPIRKDVWRIKLPSTAEHRFLSPTLHYCGINGGSALESLYFHSIENAVAYLEKHGISYVIWK